MKLTASPFNPETGELMPVYRDAYLRGDLSKASAQAVEDFLHRDADLAHETLQRWQHLRTAEQAQVAPTWVQKQLLYIRTEPVRFRRRATGLVASAVLVGTMVFAGTTLPARHTAFLDAPADEVAPTAVEASMPASMDMSATHRMMMVRGRILNENGAPLAGATVMHPVSHKAVSTNAAGEYMMLVPVGTTTLRYGYGGYQDDDVRVQSNSLGDVTLLPREDAPVKKKHWWQF